MVTIKDVAQLAGVTPSTVSRVINNTGRISEVTRQRVQQAIKDSGYRFNRNARALVTKSSGIIGFVTNPDNGFFYANLLQELSRCVLGQLQRRMMLEFGQNNEAGELEAIDRLLSESCEAIVVYSRHITEESAKKLVESNTTPIVFLNRYFSSIPANCVGIDNVACGYLATKTLINNGHRNIACIYGCPPYASGQERLEGFKKAMEEHGLPIKPELMFSGLYVPQVGWDAVDKFQYHSFTAIFSSSIGQSVGAINALHRLGYRVPDDMSLVSIDNYVLNDYLNPALTAIEIPMDQLASTAIQRVQLLKDNSQVLENARIPGHLVERDSVKQLAESDVNRRTVVYKVENVLEKAGEPE
ncbi:LacI family DNA-binding transcriptional regulator [Endozoicomonas ascidiicola]|uniref:LacI family DNA-binding transcriptional regulator n=1 Tax=Endozoicomonas ascidiicola TaxID=1698521 RepID=UPI000835F897|nr:LacI family DNA-binding transcriptional regulator [Endozoicomonas ascidiicola]